MVIKGILQHSITYIVFHSELLGKFRKSDLGSNAQYSNDDVMGNHANTIRSLNASETNRYNTTLNFMVRKVP